MAGKEPVAAAAVAAEQPKWEGKATAGLVGPTPDQVWAVLTDFCSLDKWLPYLASCEHVGGPRGFQLGQVRRCSSAAVPEEGMWTEEKLVAIDPAGRSLSYEVTASNVGVKAYVATMKVEPTDGGSKIEWSFVCEPNDDGMRREEALGMYDVGVKEMAKRMEKVLKAA